MAVRSWMIHASQTLSVEQLLLLVQRLRSEVAALTARLDQVQAENRELEQLKARLFAPKSETAAGSKSPQKRTPPELEEPAPARKRGRQPGQKTPQRRQYDHLPVVDQLIGLSEE